MNQIMIDGSAVSLTPNDEFMQISFVNGILQVKKHVEYILNQIVRKLLYILKKKDRR